MGLHSSKEVSVVKVGTGKSLHMSWRSPGITVKYVCEDVYYYVFTVYCYTKKYTREIA